MTRQDAMSVVVATTKEKATTENDDGNKIGGTNAKGKKKMEEGKAEEKDEK